MMDGPSVAVFLLEQQDLLSNATQERLSAAARRFDQRAYRGSFARAGLLFDDLSRHEIAPL